MIFFDVGDSDLKINVQKPQEYPVLERPSDSEVIGQSTTQPEFYFDPAVIRDLLGHSNSEAIRLLHGRVFRDQRGQVYSRVMGYVTTELRNFGTALNSFSDKGDFLLGYMVAHDDGLLSPQDEKIFTALSSGFVDRPLLAMATARKDRQITVNMFTNRDRTPQQSISLMNSAPAISSPLRASVSFTQPIQIGV